MFKPVTNSDVPHEIKVLPDKKIESLIAAEDILYASPKQRFVFVSYCQLLTDAKKSSSLGQFYQRFKKNPYRQLVQGMCPPFSFYKILNFISAVNSNCSIKVKEIDNTILHFP